MPKPNDNLVIDSLAGGMNNQDSPNTLPDDQCTFAENVEFADSSLGERRRGCIAVDVAGSDLEDYDVITHLAPHYPSELTVLQNELFAIAGRFELLTVFRRSSGSWVEVPFTQDTLNYDLPFAVQIKSHSIHGKLYLAARTDVDRMHVWDGTSLRRVGMAGGGAAPSVVDSGTPGTFSGERTYRVRFIEMDGSDVVRQGEPSIETVFTPSGAANGATLTIPTPPGEGETHWEFEASDGDGNFYVIATIAIGTTSHTDTLETTDYASFELSADIGEYEVVPSVRFVISDQDRLIFGGSWHDPEIDSRVSWTPVSAAPGVGNDERLPATTDNFTDLDWQDAGGLTGMSDPVNGSFYVFKLTRIYKMTRTYSLDQAYTSILLSKTRGALYGSVVSGLDEFGRACAYFLDPAMGPCRVGPAGIQYMHGIKPTWDRVNTNANLVCHGVFYPDKQQVHWWVSFDGTDTPTYKLILQVDEVQSDASGTRRGWTVAAGKITEAWCSTIVPETAIDPLTDEIAIYFRPYIGLRSPDFILRTDVGDDDNGEAYHATIKTKPYLIAGLLNRFGIMNAALLASPLSDVDGGLSIRLVRDFGLEESDPVTMDFVAEADEDFILRTFDNFRMSDAFAIQVVFEDL